MASVISCLLLGLVLAAAPVLGANIDTFARVNLVQGMEATVEAAGQEYNLSRSSGATNWFNLSGPADYCVEVHVSVLNGQLPTADEASSNSIKIDTHHDLDGNLNMPLPAGDQTDEALATNPTHYIVTLTYE